MKKALIVASVYGFIYHFERNDIKILQELGYDVTVASNFDNYKNELDNLNINLIHIPFQRNPFSLKNIIAYKKLNKFFKEERIDLIHCHTPIGGVIGRIAGHKNKIKNIIYTAHGFHFFKGAPLINWLLFYPVEKYLSKYTNVLITINQEDYKRAKTFYAKKIEYIPGVGLDTEKIKNIIVDKKKKREELGLTEDNIILLSVGELNKNKNHSIVIKALAKLNNPNIHYLICGQGNLKEELLDLIKKLNLARNVKLLGFRKDVYELCKISDIFIFPSKREGLGLAALEGMCSGLPLISSNIHGIKDYLVNEKTGYCIDRFNVNGFENAIKKLIYNKKLRQKIGNYNKEVVKKFDIRNTEKIMREIYKNI